MASNFRRIKKMLRVGMCECVRDCRHLAMYSGSREKLFIISGLNVKYPLDSNKKMIG